MSEAPSSYECSGMTTPILSSYPMGRVANHDMIDIPGGLVVIGSSHFEDATPHWVYLDSYTIGKTTVSESQYRETLGRPGFEESPLTHPATMITFSDALEYISMRDNGAGLILPTEAQWEHAARGPAQHMQEVMEEEVGRFIPAAFVEFAEERYENFVFKLKGKIFTNPRQEVFQKMIADGLPFWGWRVYSTPSGRLSHDAVWHSQKITAPVNWGPPSNEFGVKGMSGGVSEWVRDWYVRDVLKLTAINPSGPIVGRHNCLRGASWFVHKLDEDMRVGKRRSTPDFARRNRGFRVAGPPIVQMHLFR